MPQTLSPLVKQKFFNNNGTPLVGGKLFTYSAGTSIKLATYSDSGVTANANPIILDFRGECNVWIPPNVAYKFVLAPANDTDPPTQPIWTVDNVVNAQLLTLYGGVDVGSANAYILNFTAQFATYTVGTVIYWVPANSNTGASTLDVNGLGPIPIINPDGTAIIAGQIQANQVAQVIYTAAGFILVSSLQALSGTFTGTLTGCTTSPTATFDYYRIGKFVSISARAGGLSATSNTTAMTITGLPAAITPSVSKDIPCDVTNNSLTRMAGMCQVNLTGFLSFYLLSANQYQSTVFTAANTKGISSSFFIGYSL